ncbi:hypothetical protein P5673_016392 [Acropora cervicornis]|uniref:Uncharacterized protein n=1 Tax=Acropora cervicornis TaxID=6130 RepID=A0AAD9QG25_ACRCE|nr:hypothetical protein P5673_016392 [Acropora cervicornis]
MIINCMVWDMTIQCGHVIEARRPDIVVVEKESNKAIIVVDITSLWNQRVYEKEGENIDEYQNLEREIEKLWDIREQEDGIAVENSFVRNSKDIKESVGKGKTGVPAENLLEPCREQNQPIMWCRDQESDSGHTGGSVAISSGEREQRFRFMNAQSLM